MEKKIPFFICLIIQILVIILNKILIILSLNFFNLIHKRLNNNILENILKKIQKFELKFNIFLKLNI